jgi:hypothetical protein
VTRREIHLASPSVQTVQTVTTSPAGNILQVQTPRSDMEDADTTFINDETAFLNRSVLVVQTESAISDRNVPVDQTKPVSPDRRDSVIQTEYARPDRSGNVLRIRKSLLYESESESHVTTF